MIFRVIYCWMIEYSSVCVFRWLGYLRVGGELVSDPEIFGKGI